MKSGIRDDIDFFHRTLEVLLHQGATWVKFDEGQNKETRKRIIEISAKDVKIFPRKPRDNPLEFKRSY